MEQIYQNVFQIVMCMVYHRNFYPVLPDVYRSFHMRMNPIVLHRISVSANYQIKYDIISYNNICVSLQN